MIASEFKVVGGSEEVVSDRVVIVRLLMRMDADEPSSPVAF